MKKKFLAVLIAALSMTFVFALSCSALDFEARQTTTAVVSQRPTSDEAAKIIDTMQKQVQMGMIGRGKTLTLICTEPSGNGYKVCALVGLSQAISSVKDNGNGTYTLSFPSNYTYEWDSNTGFYEISSATSRTIAKENILYMNFYHDYDVGIPYTGVNPNYAYGNGDYHATTVNDYFNAIYNAVVNHEQNMESAYNSGLLDGRNEGFSQGFTEGKRVCGETHSALQEQAYNDGYLQGEQDGYTDGCEAGMDAGYDLGYETGYDEGYDVGYYIGLADCDKTHASLTQAVREEAIAYGKTLGIAFCEEGHAEIETAAYDSGYDVGYEKGYEAHAELKEIELKEKFAEGYSKGKEAGYTEALNTTDVVVEYVDGLFSAPLNFLYGAFNIEILGINLFNVLMLFLSLLIVGGVVLLVLKFR